jgi:hypothetical protein
MVITGTLLVVSPLDIDDHDGDQKGVYDQCLDEHEPENENEPDRGRSSRISGYPFARTADGFGLAERSCRSGQSDDSASNNDGQFVEHRSLFANGCFLSQKGCTEKDQEENEQTERLEF